MSTDPYILSEDPESGCATMRVLGEQVAQDMEEKFREGCLALLQTGRAELTIDLGGLRRVSSGVVAAVIDVGLLAGTGGGPVQRVKVMAEAGVAKQLRTFESSVALEICECGRGPGGCGLEQGAAGRAGLTAG